uniref:Uncharacterized protein n=1 Tax=Leersia perrieri TaxID=77586 RepID=A0A0D9X3N5_9ORYZ
MQFLDEWFLVGQDTPERDQMNILSYFTKVSCGQAEKKAKNKEKQSKLTFRKRLKWTEVSTGAPIATTFPTRHKIKIFH